MNHLMRHRNWFVQVTAMVLTFIIVFIPIRTFAVGPHAAEEGVVTGVLFVENGKSVYLQGEAARQYYDRIMRQPEMDSSALEAPDVDYTHPNSTIEPRAGSVKYGHYYVETSRGRTHGRTKRVTQYAKNMTSVTQAMDFKSENSISWSVNPGMTGKWKDAVTASLGGGWTQTYTASTALRLNISPQKTGWVEFMPYLRYSKGRIEEKFWDRTRRKWVILSTKPVTTYSPSRVTVSFEGKTSPSLDGIYIFKEKNN